MNQEAKRIITNLTQDLFGYLFVSSVATVTILVAAVVLPTL